jgi:hypothetical protein
VPKKIIFVPFMLLLVGCGVLFPSAPPRFPQFAEHSIAGPGSYQIPQWSPDSRYLAFIDRAPNLLVYDTQTQSTWTIATNVSTAHYSWTPNGDLAYLKYLPDLSGSSLRIFDLHKVNVQGENDEVIAANLSEAKDFAWFGDGERLMILLNDPNSDTYYRDLYLLNTVTNTTDLLVKANDFGFQDILSLALSSDEKSILVEGIHEDKGAYEGQIVVYDLETQTVLDRIIPGQIIPSGGINYPVPVTGDSTNFGWVGGQRWLLAEVNTPGGACYNYALFFFDTNDLQNSFCIAAPDGIFAAPTISPDLTKISYVTVAGVGQDYLMIGNLPPDLLTKLDLKSQ